MIGGGTGPGRMGQPACRNGAEGRKEEGGAVLFSTILFLCGGGVVEGRGLLALSVAAGWPELPCSRSLLALEQCKLKCL